MSDELSDLQHQLVAALREQHALPDHRWRAFADGEWNQKGERVW